MALDNTCPHVPEALLRFLQAAYPERCPDPKQDERRIWMAVGARDVVRGLEAIFALQETK